MKVAFACLSAMVFLFASLGPATAQHRNSYLESFQQEDSEIFGVEHDGVVKVIVTTDKKVMFSMSFDGLVKIWDLENGDLIRSLNAKPDLQDIHLSTDETHLLTYGRSGNLQVWDFNTGEELYGTMYEFQLAGANWFRNKNHVAIWGVGHIAILG